MRFNGSDPPNGMPAADPILALLLKQSDKTDWIIHSLGGMNQQLKTGHELHRELIKEQEEQGQAIQRIDAAHRKTQADVRRLKRRRSLLPDAETAKEFYETAKEWWHYLLLAAALAGKAYQWLSAHIGLFGAS